jgi:thiamine biosynthesis lipoprotein ApbE
MFLLLCSTAVADDALRLYEFRETHLGVPVDLRVYASDQPSANAASRAAYDRIDQLNAIFSDYDAETEAMRLCRSTGPTKVSPELFFLLDKSIAISEQTGGAFDVTISPLIKQWRRARRMKQLPTAEQIAAAKKLIGYQHLKLNAADRTVEILLPGLQLDFGGIAKGYFAEEAYKVLAAHGCPRSLVAIAGDIFAGDPPPRRTARLENRHRPARPTQRTAEPLRRSEAAMHLHLRRRLPVRGNRRRPLLAHRPPPHRPRPDRTEQRHRHRPPRLDRRRLRDGGVPRWGGARIEADWRIRGCGRVGCVAG